MFVDERAAAEQPEDEGTGKEEQAPEEKKVAQDEPSPAGAPASEEELGLAERPMEEEEPSRPSVSAPEEAGEEPAKEEAEEGSPSPTVSASEEGAGQAEQPLEGEESSQPSVSAPEEAGEEEQPAEKKGPDRASVPATDEELFQEGRSWYVVHTYSGYEDKVRANLEQRIKSMDAEDLVFRVVVPSVEEMEIRDGQRRTVPKKIFPGYVLVQMITLQEEGTRADEQELARSNKAWMVVRNSPGVTGFVGSGTAPTPLDKEEVRSIMKQMRAEEPVVKVGFNVGQSVRVSDGPFADFVGVVDEINMEKGKVKVLVSFFGRETPVELDFLQVERL